MIASHNTLETSGWVFYDPVTYQFFASQDVMFDESVCYNRSRPHQGVSHVTPQSSVPQLSVPVVCGDTGGAVAEGHGNLESAASPYVTPGFLSVPQFPPRSSLRPVAAEPGGVLAGGTGGPGGVGGEGAGSVGAGAGGTGTVAPTPCTVRFLTREQRLLLLEREKRERFERAQQHQQQQEHEQSQLQQ
ncbi:unnamed protein product [Closterium sp. NIES-53]